MNQMNSYRGSFHCVGFIHLLLLLFWSLEITLLRLVQTMALTSLSIRRPESNVLGVVRELLEESGDIGRPDGRDDLHLQCRSERGFDDTELEGPALQDGGVEGVLPGEEPRRDALGEGVELDQEHGHPLLQ